MTIKIQAIQNEDLDGKLQTALNSGSAPDVFLQRGGGKMNAMVKAGQLMDITELDRQEREERGQRRCVQGLRARRQDLRDAGRREPRGHLVQPGPVQAGRHRGHAHDDGRAERRHRQAQGRGHPAGGRRGEGRLARSALVLQLRTACLQREDAERSREGPEVHRQLLEDRRRGHEGRSSTRSPSTTATSPPRPSRARAARRASSPTTRPPWSSWARGTRA